MAAESIGNAYVTVKPKTDASFKTELEAAGKDAGTGFGSTFSVAAGNLIASSVENLAAAAVDLFQTGFGNYASYEQLVGGVDTLFKESSQIVQDNAARAFETAGMSANEYMEQVTSFSASLLQGLDGDTVAAASYADMAMRDMSDNANKMGTDMARITDAYQGFAKQNYTMLDNLKLGYGGTKSEMERLLADASEIAGVEFNIDSYDDVIEAIHVMQEQMGIAGTTAAEATGTIEGSINKLSSSWDNFLTGLFDENADLGALTDQLFASLGDVAMNVVPRIGALVGNLFTQMPQYIAGALQSLPDALTPVIDSVFGEGVGNQVMESLSSSLGGIAERIEPLGEAMGEVFASLSETLQPVIETVVAVVEAAMPVIIQAIEGVMDFLTANVLPTVQGVLDAIQPAVQAVCDFIQQVLPVVVDTVSTNFEAVKGVVDFVWPAIQATIETVMGIVSGIVETAVGIISGAFEGLRSAVDTVSGIFENIKSAIQGPIEKARDIVGGAIDAIKGFFNFQISWPYIPLPHFSASGSANPLDWLDGNLPSFSIEWYAAGGYVDDATLIGAGERGGELIWPSYEPYLSQYADALSSRIGGGGNIYNVTINSNASNGEQLAEEFTRAIERRNRLGGGSKNRTRTVYA